MPLIAQIALDVLLERTGYRGVLLLAGPHPVKNGGTNFVAVSAGETPSGATFPQAYKYWNALQASFTSFAGETIGQFVSILFFESFY